MKFSKAIIFISILISIIHLLLSLYLDTRGECILNEGIAFGISVNHIYVISIALILFLFGMAMTSKRTLRSFLFGIAILGIGNLLGRIYFSGICDYISLINISFNLIDIAIVSLCILSISHLIFNIPKTDS